MNINQTLGEYVGNAIDSSNLTRDEIAERVGVDSSYLSKLKADLVVPSPEKLAGFIRELNLNPELTHKLAEEAKKEKGIQKMRRQVVSGLNYLSTNAPMMVDNMRASIQRFFRKFPLGDFYKRVIQGGFEAADPGEKVLVLNTAQEIPMEILEGPFVDGKGDVTFVISLDNLPIQGQEFFLDLIFIPTVELIQSRKITTQEAGPLLSVNGLEYKASLPETSEEFPTTISEMLQKDNINQVAFPETAFAFRIWWEE